jgi:hypothetical protein
MPESHADEFYVGYLPKSPQGLARHTRLVIVVHLVLSMAAAAIIVAAMRDPGPGVWEDATPKSFTGVFLSRPYPMIIDDAGHAILVVDFGKRGAQQRFSGIGDAHRLKLSGYPLLRDGRTLVELAPEADAIGPASPDRAPVQAAGGDRRTLVGEIVDSKCFLGAMKPGEGKTHKACATRCISGGIPPMLVCWDEKGLTSYFLLADEQGGPVGDWVLPLVGETVQVTGDVASIGDLALLRVSREGIQRR